jgi:8-oxo-dGTP pyrophosphatase MutT (NUDIX family)
MKKKIKPLLDAITTYPCVSLPETPTPAAVLVLLISDDSENLFVVLTKRPASIATYAGDYCFPGGMRDEGEIDLKLTAIREVEEELAIKADTYQFIGQLDDFFDRFDNLVRPFVATMSKTDFENQLQISESEIEAVYYLPIEKLSEFNINHDLEQMTGRQPSYIYTDNDTLIWGLTASIIVHLGNVMFDLQRPLAKHKLPSTGC